MRLKENSLPVAWLLVFFSNLTLKVSSLLPISTAHCDSEHQNEQSVDCIKSFVRVLVLELNDQLGVKYGGSKYDHGESQKAEDQSRMQLTLLLPFSNILESQWRPETHILFSHLSLI